MKRILSLVVLCSVIMTAAANAAIIGVDFGPEGQTSPTNWNGINTQGLGDPLTFSNLIDENGNVTSVSVSVEDLTETNTSNDVPTFASSQLPSHSNSLVGIDGNAYNFGNTRITFGGLIPGFAYSVWLLSGDIETVSQTVTISGGSPSVVFSVNSPANTLFINGVAGSDQNSFYSYALQQTADSNGQIAFTLETNATYTAAAGVAIEAAAEAVPEPSTIALVSGGAIFALVARRRKATN